MSPNQHCKQAFANFLWTCSHSFVFLIIERTFKTDQLLAEQNSKSTIGKNWPNFAYFRKFGCRRRKKGLRWAFNFLLNLNLGSNISVNHLKNRLQNPFICELFFPRKLLLNIFTPPESRVLKRIDVCFINNFFFFAFYCTAWIVLGLGYYLT